MAESNSQPLFRDLRADDDHPEMSEIESLCMNCEEMGTSRLLLTKIPFFKELVVMSFECPHCGNKSNEVQSAGVIQDEGVRIQLHVTSPKDLDRQVVKQASAKYLIPELDFEAPAFTTKGALTTIEGLLSNAVEGLEQGQPVRKIMDPYTAAKIDSVISKLKVYAELKENFTFILEDTSGNSFIENPYAPEKDPCLSISYFKRTREDTEKLGFRSEDTEADESSNHVVKTTGEESADDTTTGSPTKDEVFEFPVNCPSCQSPTVTRMKSVLIPHFKEVIIMATTCDACGFKSNEVKSGGGIEDFGRRITLKMTDVSDLSRDVLKAETCSVRIPELELESCAGTLGGKFTTVEGLLESMKDQIKTINPFLFGDSATYDQKEKIDTIIGKIDEVISGKHLITLILDDPVGNSFLQNPNAPDPDPNMVIETYKRTFEQNEELGLNDLVTERYTNEENGHE